MPVYKITEKKLAKRKREDEDGTTELKEALGLGGEGSESESEGSSSESSTEDEDEEESEESDVAEEVDAKSAGESEDDSDTDDSSSDEEEVEDKVEAEGSGTSEDDSEDSPSSEAEDTPRARKSKPPRTPLEIPVIPGESPMSIEQVSINPIFSLPERPTATGCILCPTRTMKTPKMVDVHLKSGSHVRSFKRWEKALKDWEQPKKIAERPDDPRAIVAMLYRDVATKKEREDAHLKAKVQAHVVARKARKEVKKAAKLADRAANPRSVKQPKILSEKDQAAHDAKKARKKAEKAARQVEKKRRKEEREQLRQQAIAEGHIPGNANSVPVGGGAGQKWGGGGGEGVSRTWMGGQSGGYGSFALQAKKRSSPRMIRKRAKEAKLIAMGIDPHAKTGDEAMSKKQKKHLKKQEKREKQAMRRAGVRLQKMQNKGGRND